MDTDTTPVPQPPKILPIGLKWGLILGLVLSICLAFQMGFSVMRAPWWQTAIQWLAFALMIYFGIRDYRNRPDAALLTFGRAVKVGFAITCWAALLSLLLLYIASNYIFPDFLSGMKDLAKLTVENSPAPLSTAERIATVIDTMFNPLIWSLSQVLNTILTGLIFTLLAAIFLRQEKR